LKLKEIQKIIKEILRYLSVDEGIEVSILITNDAYIKKLNFKYRGIDKPTDVLSFSFKDDDSFFPEVDGKNILGDIIISAETVAKQASEMKHSVKKEMVILLIHGLLHLLGYDHIEDDDYKKMRKKEKEIMAILFFLYDN